MGLHLVRQVGVSLAVEQQPHGLDVAVLRGHLKRRDAVLRRAVVRRAQVSWRDRPTEEAVGRAGGGMTRLGWWGQGRGVSVGGAADGMREGGDAGA